MKAIVATDKAAGTAGVKLVERPEPQAAINDVVVQIHASGFTGDELTVVISAISFRYSIYPKWRIPGDRWLKVVSCWSPFLSANPQVVTARLASSH